MTRAILALSLSGLLAPAAALAAPLVLAAASLQESLNAAGDAWAADGHSRPVLSFAATSALARQIASGAPADLFLSADEDWMDYVEKRGLVRAGTRTTLLGNRLVLIVPRGSKARVRIAPGFPLAPALGGGHLAIADPDAVPAGKYAKAALSALGVWSEVDRKLARAENVRAALALVERGETPFGIVYATDARASDKVRVIGVFPASTHPPIAYPIAVLKTSRAPDTEAFYRFLASPKGKAIFERYGFASK